MKGKKIFIQDGDKMTDITDLNKKDYEEFLDVMMQLNVAYSVAVATRARRRR